MKTESKKRYERKYKKRIKRLQVDLYPTDSDIMEWLAKVSKDKPKATYIKKLIRDDISANKIVSEVFGDEE